MLKTTRKNNIVIMAMIILLSIMMAFVFCNFNVALAEENMKNTKLPYLSVYEKDNCKLASNERLLYDFAGNKYILKEDENYFSITHAETGLLIEENDYNASSPYQNYDKIWYCGPMSYFYEESNKIYSISDNEEVTITQDAINYCNEFNDFMIKEYKKQTKNGISTYSYGDKIDYYELEYPDFFKNLNTTNYNTTGICGYVAAASLLAYYDYCNGDNSFIKSNYWVSKSSNNIVYSKSLCNDLRDYGNNNGTTADTIKSVMKKYFEDRNQTNVKHYSWLGCFTTNAMLCDSIAKNNPVIIFGSIYSPVEHKKVNHAVVVYRGSCSYINGSTICSYWVHYGWGKEYNNVKLTNNVADFIVGTSYYINIK